MTESRAILLVIVVAFLWAAAALATQAVASGVEPGLFLLVEFMVAYLALGVIYRSRMRSLGFKPALQGILLGVLLFILHYLVLSHQEISPFVAINSMSLSIIVIAILWAAISREGLGIWAGASIILCAAGVYLVNPMYDFVFLAILVVFAFHVVFTAIFVRHSAPEHLVVVQTAVATILSITTLHLDGKAMANMWAWVVCVLTGLLGVAWGVLVQTRAQRLLSPIKVGVLFTLQSVVVIGFLGLTSGTDLGHRAIIGVTMIVTGIVAGLKINSTSRETVPRIDG